MTAAEIASGLILVAGYIVGMIIAFRRFREDAGHMLTYLATWLGFVVIPGKVSWESLLPTNTFMMGSTLPIGEAIIAAIIAMVFCTVWVEATWYLWLAVRRFYRMVPKP